jgi:hypothetical protein
MSCDRSESLPAQPVPASDEDYRGFIDLLAGQMSAAITRGRA